MTFSKLMTAEIDPIMASSILCLKIKTTPDEIFYASEYLLSSIELRKDEIKLLDLVELVGILNQLLMFLQFHL